MYVISIDSMHLISMARSPSVCDREVLLYVISMYVMNMYAMSIDTMHLSSVAAINT